MNLAIIIQGISEGEASAVPLPNFFTAIVRAMFPDESKVTVTAMTDENAPAMRTIVALAALQNADAEVVARLAERLQPLPDEMLVELT